MFLARVIGTVVSTQKNAKCQGMKLLLIQPYILQGETLAPSGSSVVAVDTVCAGHGELVLFTQGSSARLTDLTRDTPIDAVIVGVVDTVETGGKLVASARGAVASDK
jgi:ethanolamine utilization protein EutN